MSFAKFILNRLTGRHEVIDNKWFPRWEALYDHYVEDPKCDRKKSQKGSENKAGNCAIVLHISETVTIHIVQRGITISLSGNAAAANSADLVRRGYTLVKHGMWKTSQRNFRKDFDPNDDAYFPSVVAEIDELKESLDETKEKTIWWEKWKILYSTLATQPEFNAEESLLGQDSEMAKPDIRQVHIHLNIDTGIALRINPEYVEIIVDTAALEDKEKTSNIGKDLLNKGFALNSNPQSGKMKLHKKVFNLRGQNFINTMLAEITNLKTALCVKNCIGTSGIFQ